jgi:signal transduction histidine kinase
MRLVVWYTLLFVLIAASFGFYTYKGVEYYLTASLKDTLARRAQQISSYLLPQVVHADAQTRQQTLESLYAPEANNRFIRISHPDGTTLYTSGAPQDESFAPESLPPALDERSVVPLRGESHFLGKNRQFYRARQVTQFEQQQYIIEVGSADGSINKALDGLLKILAMGFPALLLIGVFGGRLLVKQALAKVTAVTRAAEALTIHDTGERLPNPHTGDEFETLTATLNRLIDRLQEAYRSSVRFTADASHELRTPLTIVRGELEALMQLPDLPKGAEERLSSLLEEMERLSRITSHLLLLSYVDERSLSVSEKPVELKALLLGILEQVRPIAAEKQLLILAHADADAWVCGNDVWITQMIVNLLDNSIKYTPSGGSIEVTLHQETTATLLTFSDSGIGIPAESLPHIFERFYRADTVRSSDYMGAGLGLSLVARLVKRMHGSISAESTLGKGSIFRVRLPLYDPNASLEQGKTT